MKIDKEKLAKIIAFIIIGYFVLYGICDFTLNTFGTEDINKPFNKSHYSASYVVNISDEKHEELSLRGIATINISRESLYKKKKIFLDEISIGNEQWIPYDNFELLIGKRIKCSVYDSKDLNVMADMFNEDLELDKEAFNEDMENYEPHGFDIFVELTTEKAD